MEFLLDGLWQAVLLLVNLDAETVNVILTTLKVSALSMAASLIIGIPLGFLLGYTEFPGRKFMRLISDTLMAFPTVLIGLLVYAFISRRGPLGDLNLLFTITGMAVGQTILALPIVTSLTAQSLQSLDERLKLTLLTLGASQKRLALDCVYEARFSVLIAAVTAFGRVLTEVGIAMMLGGNIKWETRTITTAITLETGKGEFAQGIALGMVLLLMAFLINLALTVFRRKDSAKAPA